ncbi:hypothetical protein B0J15DRAFT_492152 [Fusarium solani]|jgi:hypothetical protein|uniref:Uncharacterized protein n=1 Tax=Fusarium solani TaxID=169388 RepID=A0A9P9HME0_FUSSL|nr:uncharacterized protein B0J15DRAFT_492152 [Fusarium solani]KAH7260225.1 hypothetical protein B0J15DRAFT_492152 [Fusarium solani]
MSALPERNAETRREQPGRWLCSSRTMASCVHFARPGPFRPSLLTLLVSDASALSVVRCKKRAWLHQRPTTPDKDEPCYGTLEQKKALAENSVRIASPSNHNQPTIVSSSASADLLMHIIKINHHRYFPRPPSPTLIKASVIRGACKKASPCSTSSLAPPTA